MRFRSRYRYDSLFMVFYCAASLVGAGAYADQELISNTFILQGKPPAWLKMNRLESLAEKMEQKLEWKIKKVPLKFYSDEPSFWRSMKVPNSSALAFVKSADQSIHIGPKLNAQNFDIHFRHELSHVILFQKYKGHIPTWLEEGLANLHAGNTQVNYGFISSQKKLRGDVRVENFSHPLKATSFAELDFYYQAATAAAVMIKEKCGSMDELLNLALKDHLTKQFKTYCQIEDLNEAFWKWIEKKASQQAKRRVAP